MSVWRCPICAASMQHEEHSLHCLNGHCFDLAKSGYVNLLPVQQKHTKQPGDNLQMIRARRDFLQAGYYQPFQQALCAMVVQAMPQQGILLDAGCGDGYYTKAVTEALQAAGKAVHVYGVDISKYAVDLAAKQERQRHLQWAVSFICRCLTTAVMGFFPCLHRMPEQSFNGC